MNPHGVVGDLPFTFVRGQHTFDLVGNNLAFSGADRSDPANFRQPVFAVRGLTPGFAPNPPYVNPPNVTGVVSVNPNDIDHVLNPTSTLDPWYGGYIAMGGNPYGGAGPAPHAGAHVNNYPFVTLEVVVPASGAYQLIDFVEFDFGNGGDWDGELVWSGGVDAVTFHRGAFLGDVSYGSWRDYYWFKQDEIVTLTYINRSGFEFYFGVYNSIYYAALRPTTGVRPPDNLVHSVPSPPFADLNDLNAQAGEARTHFWKAT